MKNASLLPPLPLPRHWQDKIQRLPPLTHLAVALIINLLSLALPVMMLQVYDRIIPHKSYGTLLLLTVGVCVALAFDALLRILRAWLVGWSAASYEHAAGCAALGHLAGSEIGAFEQSSTGEHLQNFAALGRMREFASGQGLIAMVDLPFAAIFLALIAYLGGALAFVPLTLLLLFSFSAGAAGRRLRRALETRRAADDEKSSLMVSILSGIHTVKALALESVLLRRFEAAQGHVTAESYRVALASGLAGTLSAAFGQLSLILTAAAGAMMVLEHHLSIGGLSACSFLAGRAIQPVQRVLGTWLRLQDMAISRRQAEKIFTLPLQPRAAAAPAFAPSGRVVVENLSFAYRDGAPVFDDVSFSLEPGECLALSGARGCGKTTLLQLLAGLLVPSGGNLRVDDIDPVLYSLSSLRGHIGYMPQNGAIFRGSILDNLTGFRDGDAAVAGARAAAEDLGLDAVIDILPRGYQTMLHDTGADPVPPGVKQRIALARALAARPSLLLFDDADRALDKEGYNRLFRLMGRLKGRTTLVIASEDRNLLSFADTVYALGERHDG